MRARIYLFFIECKRSWSRACFDKSLLSWFTNISSYYNQVPFVNKTIIFANLKQQADRCWKDCDLVKLEMQALAAVISSEIQDLYMPRCRFCFFYVSFFLPFV